MDSDTTNSHAIVLSGGGAYAAYEVGVLKALYSGACPSTGLKPVAPDILCGTSAGAFNAAILASQPEPAGATTATVLESVWLYDVASRPGHYYNGIYRIRLDFIEWLNPIKMVRYPRQSIAEIGDDTVDFVRQAFRRGGEFFASTGSLGRRFVDMIDVSNFVCTEPFERLIRQVVDPGAIRRSKLRQIRLATTNWRTGKLKTFENREMTDEDGPLIVLASAALPGFFPPITLGAEIFVDGGVVMNTPLLPAIRAGADVIHAIYLETDVSSIPLERLQSTASTLDRFMVAASAVVVNNDIETARGINLGLRKLKELRERPPAEEQVDDSLLAAAALRAEQAAKPDRVFKPLTVHRYRPKRSLGGIAGILNMDLDHIQGLINYGYHDAINHECVTAGCLLP